MLDKHLPLSHDHSRPSSAASASTSTSTNSSPFSSPQSPVTSSSLPSSSSSSSSPASAAYFDDFLQHLNFAPTITSSLNFPPSNPRSKVKADPLLSPLSPPFTAEALSQSSSFSIAPTVTSSLSSSPRHSAPASSAGRPQAVVPPLMPSQRAQHQPHRDFVHSAHLPQQHQQQQQQSSSAESMLSSSLLDDDDDLSAAWNGHSTLSFDSVDDYDETDFQLAAQQLRVTTAAKQLMADIANSKATQPPHIRSVSVNSTATSTIIAPPGFHYHGQQHQQNDAAAELAGHVDNLALSRDWDTNTRSQSLSQQQPTSTLNHYQLYSGVSNSQPSTSFTHKLHQPHSSHSSSLAASFPVPLHSQPVSGPANGCNLYVDQLPIPFSEHDLRTIFTPFGHIEKLRVAIDPLTGNYHIHPHCSLRVAVLWCCVEL